MVSYGTWMEQRLNTNHFGWVLSTMLSTYTFKVVISGHWVVMRGHLENHLHGKKLPLPCSISFFRDQDSSKWPEIFGPGKLATVMLVTLWCWWLTVGDNFRMLATELRYWRHLLDNGAQRYLVKLVFDPQVIWKLSWPSTLCFQDRVISWTAGKSRIRHGPTLKWNDTIFNRFWVDLEIQFQSRSMSDPTLFDIDFKNKMALVGTTLKEDARDVNNI